MKRKPGRLSAILVGPFREVIDGLDVVLVAGWRSLVRVGLGLVAGWWLYVPAHELLHAAGCLVAGGAVSRLEIDPMYGATALSRIFPFVVPGSAYAGRLSGFDTRGSDWVYLATDLAPFLLALLPGFLALRWAARCRRPFLFGATLPAALAPFLSLTGDAYEIGSLAAVHLPPWKGHRALVGDDLGAKAAEIAAQSDGLLFAGFATAALLGTLWAIGWTALARQVAAWFGQPALTTAARGIGGAGGSGSTSGVARVPNGGEGTGSG